MGRKGARWLSSVGYQVFQFETEWMGPLKSTLSIALGQFWVLVQSQRRQRFRTVILRVWLRDWRVKMFKIQLMRWMFGDCWNGYFVGRDKTLNSILNTHVVPQNPSKSIEHESSEVVFPTLSSRQPTVYSAPHVVRGLLIYRGIDCICHLFSMKRESIRL